MEPAVRCDNLSEGRRRKVVWRDLNIEVFKTIRTKRITNLTKFLRRIYNIGMWLEDFVELIIMIVMKSNTEICEDFRGQLVYCLPYQICWNFLTTKIKSINNLVNNNLGSVKGCRIRDTIGANGEKKCSDRKRNKAGVLCWNVWTI